MSTLLNTWSSKHSLIPCFQGGKLVNIYTSPKRSCNPTPMSDICDCAFITDEIARSGFLKLRVEDAVKTAGFVDVAIDAVFDSFGCVSAEVVGLALPARLLVIEF